MFNPQVIQTEETKINIIFERMGMMVLLQGSPISCSSEMKNHLAVMHSNSTEQVDKKNYKFRTKDNAYGFELLEYGQRPRNTFRLGN